MQQLLTENLWLALIAALLLGMLIMWLLEMFILRRSIKVDLANQEAELKKRDTDLQNVQNELGQSNAALRAKGDELQNALNARTASDKTIAELKTQLARSNTDVDAALKTRQQLEATLNARTGELAELRTKYTTLAGEQDQTRASLTSTQAELQDTRAHQRGAVAEVAKLTAAAAATAAVVKNLESSKSALIAQIEALNGELTNARAALDDGNVARVQLEKDLDGTRAEAQNAASMLEASHATRARLEAQIGDADLRIGDLEGQVSDLESKNSALDADVAKLTAGALAAAAVIKGLEDDKSSLTAQHAQLQGEFESLARAKALDDAQLAELKLQLSQVNNALGITTRDKETYQQTLAARVTELGEAQTQLVQAKQDNSSLLTDIAKFTARAATAAALVQGLEGNKRDLNAQVEQLRTELDAERAHTQSLQAAQAEAQSALMEPTETHASQAASENAEMELSASNGDGGEPELALMQETLAVAALTQAAQKEDGTEPYASVCPQDLSVIRGIGVEFEDRLYRAGIGTYWEISQCSDDELAAILELDEVQRMSVNLAAIRGQALELARETGTQKRSWKGGVPDDFDMLVGIGRVYEGRLYEAGICTFEALSQTSLEELARICHAPQLNQNHYQSWIDQARALVEARRKGL